MNTFLEMTHWKVVYVFLYILTTSKIKATKKVWKRTTLLHIFACVGSISITQNLNPVINRAELLRNHYRITEMTPYLLPDASAIE